VSTLSSHTDNLFGVPGSTQEIEESSVLAPKFDRDGLLPCVVTNRKGGAVLMFAYMNADALARTIETGEAHYWSRSRGELWRKGATSGHVQKVIDLRIDCDQDAVWMIVEQVGAACHVGYQSCFYRSIPLGGTVAAGNPALSFAETEKVFDPRTVYSKN
jgi:phosphoribosyl-AMP cyclohydrolase